ncbi:MAG TPA: hypothetical protein PK819_00930 [Thermomicrobiales bacterium]|nr:hypothetical protein [Thermomicrobiales bacterium]
MERHHTTPIATLIAEYLTQLAAWRRQRYDDDLRDKRNLVSAEGILALAAYIKTLPKDDARLLRLDHLWRRGEQIEVRQQAAYEIGRFRFFNPAAEFDTFLDDVIVLAEADISEGSRFGGRQVPGDEPWN